MPQQVKSLSSFSFEELVILEKFFESPWGQMTLRLEEKINAKAIVHYLAKSYSINRARLDCHARDSILVNIHTGINSQGCTIHTNTRGRRQCKWKNYGHRYSMKYLTKSIQNQCTVSCTFHVQKQPIT